MGTVYAFGSASIAGGYVGNTSITKLYKGNKRVWPELVIANNFNQPTGSAARYIVDSAESNNIGVGEDGSIYAITRPTNNSNGNNILSVRKYTPGGNSEGEQIGNDFGAYWADASALYRPYVGDGPAGSTNWKSFSGKTLSSNNRFTIYPELFFFSDNLMYVLLLNGDTSSANFGWMSLFKWDGTSWSLITNRLNEYKPEGTSNGGEGEYNMAGAGHHRNHRWVIDPSTNTFIAFITRNELWGSYSQTTGREHAIATYNMSTGVRTLTENILPSLQFSAQAYWRYPCRGQGSNANKIYICPGGSNPLGPVRPGTTTKLFNSAGLRYLNYVIEYDISTQAISVLANEDGNGSYVPMLYDFFAEGNKIQYMSSGDTFSQTVYWMGYYNDTLYALCAYRDYWNSSFTYNGPNLLGWFKWDSVNTKWVSIGDDANWIKQHYIDGTSIINMKGNGLLTVQKNNHSVQAISAEITSDGTYYIFNGLNYSYTQGASSGSKPHYGEGGYGSAIDLQWKVTVASGSTTTGVGSDFNFLRTSGSNDIVTNGGVLQSYLDSNDNIRLVQTKDSALAGFPSGISFSTYDISNHYLIE